MAIMSNGAGSRRQRNKFLCVVDDTPEVRAALRYATRRARNVGGGVTLLRVIPRDQDQHWAGVGELMRAEAREAAEKLLHTLAERVQTESGIMPELVIREGDTKDELLALMSEDSSIRILVLAAAAGKQGPGPLVSALAGQMSGNLAMPIIVVPGSLSDEQIDELT